MAVERGEPVARDRAAAWAVASEQPDLATLGRPERVEEARRLLRQARSESLDRLATLAAQVTGAPYAQISMLTDRQVVAGTHGFELSSAEQENPLEASLCAVAVAGGGPLNIPDASADARVAALEAVRAGQVGAYLGIPVVVSGEPVGALCVHAPAARTWSPEQVGLVEALAVTVAKELELNSLAVEAVQTAMRLDLGFAAANIGSFEWVLDTNALWWDERLIALFGYGDDFVAHLNSFNRRVHPDDRARTDAALAEAVRTCGEYATEYRIVLPDGATRWVAARGRVLPGADGRPERMLGAAYDTTATHASGERLTRLLETMSSAFYSVDSEWNFTYVNAQAEKLLRRGRDEILGHNLWEEFPEAIDTAIAEHYHRAADTGEAEAFELFYPPLDTWFEIRAWPSPDGLSVFFHDVSARVLAQEERARALERLEVVSAAGSRLSASLEIDQVLQVLSALVLPRFGDWLTVALRGDLAAMLTGNESVGPDDLVVVHVAGSDPDTEARLRRTLVDGDEPAGDLPAGPGRSALARREPPSLTRSLSSRGRTIGVLEVGHPPPEPADRDLLGEIATRAGVALDNAVLYGEERRAAIALQRSLLPTELPDVPEVVTAARYIPGTAGRDVGGDFYVLHELDDGRVLMAIGDVMGHGMRAAAQMGQLRAVLTAYGFDGDDPDRVLARVADRADDLLDVGMATVALLVYDPAARRLTAATAGHPPPLIAPLDAPPAYLAVRPGPPIGAGVAHYESVTVDVPPGTTVVLYTDGLIESRTEPIDAGLDLLRDALIDIRLPPEAVCDHVLRKLDRAAGASDDVALLVFSHA